MQVDPFLIAGLIVFVAITVADVYVDVLYHGLGRRVFLWVSAGRFPPALPSRLQRLVTSTVGLAVILAVLLLVALVAKLVA
jgi:hypothetical protein